MTWLLASVLGKHRGRERERKKESERAAKYLFLFLFSRLGPVHTARGPGRGEGVAVGVKIERLCELLHIGFCRYLIPLQREATPARAHRPSRRLVALILLSGSFYIPTLCRNLRMLGCGCGVPVERSACHEIEIARVRVFDADCDGSCVVSGTLG